MVVGPVRLGTWEVNRREDPATVRGEERNPDRFAEAVAHAGGGGGGEEGPPTKTPGPVFPKWWSQTPVVVVTQAALVTRRNPGPFPSRRRVEGKARRWGRLGLRG